MEIHLPTGLQFFRYGGISTVVAVYDDRGNNFSDLNITSDVLTISAGEAAGRTIYLTCIGDHEFNVTDDQFDVQIRYFD